MDKTRPPNKAATPVRAWTNYGRQLTSHSGPGRVSAAMPSEVPAARAPPRGTRGARAGRAVTVSSAEILSGREGKAK
ncbi:hypothetical protein ACOMHN_011906 [Nucella lapillus]